MSMNVADYRSNSYEQIEFAFKQIGRSESRRRIFEFIYKGKKPIKTVDEISLGTGLSSKRVLEEAKKLSKNSIIKQIKVKSKTAYQKDEFYSAHKAKILSLVSNPGNISKLPSKRKVTIKIETDNIKLPKKLINIKKVFLDDIDSFREVRFLKKQKLSVSLISESNFKEGIKQIIGEKGSFTDWGGEKNDLLSTKVLFNKKRIATAFAFKGPGKKGKLTPAKMGKNGDQIQRLFSSAADLFILQYWGQIDESVYEQMESFSKLRSISMQARVYYCIIDGQDTSRIINAFPDFF